MDYKEAVALAKQGDERGYGFLYETTYKSKYYLALQYMKNEEAARMCCRKPTSGHLQGWIC